jgi:exodeoxyribonuclease VII small subunit
MAQKKSPDEPAEKSPDDSLVFEEAAERLETIVREMENGSLALEQLISHYEEGMRLVNFCSRSLTAAEKRIEVIQQNARGELSTAPAEDLEAAAKESSAPSPRTSSKSRSQSQKASRKDQPAEPQKPSAADDAGSETTDDELSLF